MEQQGILTLDGQKYPTDSNEMIPLGELGHGTCGHVVKMRHARTGHHLAVKVSTSQLYLCLHIFAPAAYALIDL